MEFKNETYTLLLKNKLKFVNDEIVHPPWSDAMFDVQERCNVMAISWITQIKQRAMYINNTKDIWKD